MTDPVNKSWLIRYVLVQKDANMDASIVTRNDMLNGIKSTNFTGGHRAGHHHSFILFIVKQSEPRRSSSLIHLIHH